MAVSEEIVSLLPLAEISSPAALLVKVKLERTLFSSVKVTEYFSPSHFSS